MKIMSGICLMMLSLFAQAGYLSTELFNGDQIILNKKKECDKKNTIKIHNTDLKFYGFVVGPGRQVSLCWNYLPGHSRIGIFYSTGEYMEYSVHQFKNVSRNNREIGD